MLFLILFYDYRGEEYKDNFADLYFTYINREFY